MSPKLLRPVVENEVLPDDGWFGDGCWSASRMLVTESNVEDLVLLLNGPRTDGVEWAEWPELDESFRDIVGRGFDRPADDREGDGSGEM